VRSGVLKWGVMEMVVWSVRGPSPFVGLVERCILGGRKKKLAGNLDTVPPTYTNWLLLTPLNLGCAC
jgi:hypothetical protein